MTDHNIHTVLQLCVWFEPVPSKEHSGVSETVVGTGPPLEVSNRPGARRKAKQRTLGRG